MTWFRLENLWLRKKINLTGFKPRSISNSNRNFKWIQFLNYYNKIETASLVNLIHSLHIFLVFIKIYKLNVKILGHATRAHIWNISQYISHNDVLKKKRKKISHDKCNSRCKHFTFKTKEKTEIVPSGETLAERRRREREMENTRWLQNKCACTTSLHCAREALK